MNAQALLPWIVLKFGGTSVSSLNNWRNIASIVNRRRAEGAAVLVVHSAVSGITDKLEKLLLAALQGHHEAAMAAIEERHDQLCADLGLGRSEQLQGYFTELRQIAQGVSLMGEVSDRTRARVMANGELMATEIGSRFLQQQGIDVRWWDARDGLRAEERSNASSRGSLLSATCDFSPDAALGARLQALAPVVISQGFIARDNDGNTVLLGRGGSDTSGAYFAAKLQALRLEIWTDVPGMFSANPRSTPASRLLRELHYDEAQEIASSGAKVLHPRCILPVRAQHIPLFVYATQSPDMEGTHISATPIDGSAKVKAVCVKKGITLLALDSPGMWHEVGFLADAFQIIKQHGLSVDLVSTSETNVTVSLDPAANTLDAAAIEAVVADLSQLSRVQVIGPCASVSLVGRNIRAILHQLGGAFEFFEEQRIYLVSQAANDLNFTFVVDEDQADRLVNQLHDLLIQPVPGDRVLGPTWEQLFNKPAAAGKRPQQWWEAKSAELLQTLGTRDAAYVYDTATLRNRAQSLLALKAIDRVLYATKANPNASIVQLLQAEGVGMECVSRGEIENVLAALPQLQTNPTKKNIWKHIERWIFPKLKNIFTVNDSIAKIYSDEYKVDVKVVRNIPLLANQNKLKEISKQELGIPLDKKIIVLQGAGINIDRGAEEAVQAMKFVNNAVLLIIGSGDVIEVLKQMVLDLKLSDKVIFIGKVPFEKLLQYTHHADLGLTLDKDTNINYRYSLPNKLFDYIHAGVPVLASNLVEIKKIIIDHSIGDCIDNHTPNHIADKINHIINDEEKILLWKKNCKIAAAKLNWEIEEQELISVYSKFL